MPRENKFASIDGGNVTSLRQPRMTIPFGWPPKLREAAQAFVNSMPADHFRQGDQELVRRWIEVSMLLAMGGLTVSQWCQLCNRQSGLARQLRLGPSSRGNHIQAAKRAGESGGVSTDELYEQLGLGDHDERR